MSLFDFFFTPKCINCGKYIDRGAYLCADCLLLWQSERITTDGDVISIAKYNKNHNTIARALVLKMKSFNDIRLYEFLADELMPALNDKLSEIEYITNVPRTKENIRENGLDQAALLAKMIAKKNNLTYVDTLENHSKTVQKLLNFDERKINAGKAYTIKRKFADKLHGHKILLIDDVTTSGASLKSCRDVLLQNGAANVVLATICVTL